MHPVKYPHGELTRVAQRNRQEIPPVKQRVCSLSPPL